MHSLPSVFYIGFEKTAKANDIMLTLHHKQNIDLAAAQQAYESLIHDFPATRVDYDYNTASKRHEWRLMPEQKVHLLLEEEQQQQATFHKAGDVYSSFSATNSCLPIRLRHIAPDKSVFLISHVFADGRTTFSWLNEWCKRYLQSVAGEATNPEQSFSQVDPIPAHWNAPGAPGNRLKLAWKGAGHFLSLISSLGVFPGKSLVDISKGKIPDPSNTDSHVASIHFSSRQTSDIIANAHTAGLSTAGLIHHALCSALFECFPHKTRQFFGIASDVSRHFQHADPLAPGCLINPHLAVVRSDIPLREQIRSIYEKARGDTPVSLLTLSSLLVPSENFLVKHVAKTTLVPASKRSLLERLTFIYSHVRDGNFEHSNRLLASVSGHTKSQTVFVASTIINGRLSLEMCATGMIFSPQDIDRWFAKATGSLLDNRFAYQ